MGIEAYLDVEEDKEVQELSELGPDEYKGLAQDLAISKAEQSIIEEVVAVDGDDEEDEEEELRDEREMKTLFEQLYEIDPDTKEVFVKGSAYDLKKWDEDMVCFTFGDPERVIALEAAISPGERYLSKCFDRLAMKHSQLADVVRRHSNNLRAKTISKSFAQDFKQVMGYPIPNVHMESFTVMPSPTNYNIAMEEMTNQQMALAAGAGIAGVAVIYKLIQWFARALNKNSLATKSISENFQAYADRREMLKNLPTDIKKMKSNIDTLINQIKDETGKIQPGINKDIADLQAAFDSDDKSKLLKSFTSAHLNKKLEGKKTPFIKALLLGIVDENWWASLGRLTASAKDAQVSVLAKLNEISGQFTLDRTKENITFLDFAWVEEMNNLNLAKLANSDSTTSAKVPYDKGQNNWQAVSSWFQAASSAAFTAPTEDFALVISDKANEGFAKINLSAFEGLDESYVARLNEIGNKIKSHADKIKTSGEGTTKENSTEKADRAQALMILTKEFQFVSSIIRFVIQVRNELGKVSVALNGSTSTLGKFFGVK